MSWPSTVKLPEVLSVSRFSIRSRVDLPAPDRPMIPIMHDRLTDSVALSTAVFAPNDLVRLVISSMYVPKAC